jgi:hypothetical protein
METLNGLKGEQFTREQTLKGIEEIVNVWGLCK